MTVTTLLAILALVLLLVHVTMARLPLWPAVLLIILAVLLDGIVALPVVR